MDLRIAKAAISVEVPMYACIYMYVHVHTIIQKEQTQSFLQEKAYLCGILNRIFADVFNQFLGLFWQAKKT